MNVRVPAPPDLGSVHATRLRKLETIAIQGLVVGTHPISCAGFTHASSLLNSWSVVSPQLSTVDLSFLVYGEGGPNETSPLANSSLIPEWARLETALARWKADVVLHAWSLARTAEGGARFLPVGAEDLRRVVRTRMPRLDGRTVVC